MCDRKEKKQNTGIHIFQQNRLHQGRITRSLEFDQHPVLWIAHTVLETGFTYILRWRGVEEHTQLGPIEELIPGTGPLTKRI
jgi:hypothetical protein